MSEERLVEILKRVSKDKTYIILIDDSTAAIEDNGLWIMGEYGESHFCNFYSIRIVQECGNELHLKFNNSDHYLTIVREVNINEL